MTQVNTEPENQEAPCNCCGASKGTSCTCSDVPQEDLSPAQHELNAIYRKMNDDPTGMGIRMMGKDGILRSFDADRNVIDAYPLTPALIKAYLDRFPYISEWEATMRGVDGTKVPEERWFHPDREILPPPLPEKWREHDEQKLEERRRCYYNMREQVENGTLKPCPIKLMSDNKVD